MNARFYVPYINRFLTADTIVPDPSNPQAYNRYSYGYNNPVKYNDPSGHIACDFEHLPSEGHCDSNGGWVPELDAHLSVEENLGIINTSVHVVAMPQGVDPAVNANNRIAQTLDEAGIDPELVEYLLNGLSVGLDLAEMISIFGPPGLAQGIGFVDAGVTILNCALIGECYYDQPHPDLPKMIVANQDVMVAVFDALVNHYGFSNTNRADFVTSAFSLVHDFVDFSYGVPNAVSIGVEVTPQGGGQVDVGLYILFYYQVVD